jgi:hypothetical protein
MNFVVHSSAAIQCMHMPNTLYRGARVDSLMNKHCPAFLTILVILGLLVLTGCNQQQKEIPKLLPQDLTLNSARWDCKVNECGKITTCGGFFTTTLNVRPEVNTAPQFGGKPCKPFVDGQSFPQPHDTYFLSGTQEAGIPLEHAVNAGHIIKVCCSSDLNEFWEGNYDICKEILLDPLCSTQNNGRQEHDQSIVAEPKDATESAKSVCGDGICSSEEGTWCVDCAIPCPSNYCNSHIMISCDDCYEWQMKFLPIVFDSQNAVYNCLSNYFAYSPDRRIQYEIDKGTSPCDSKYNCTSVGTAGRTGVHFYGFSGIIRGGESSVQNIDDLRSDIHETAHVFTFNALGNVPLWFSEGVSIYVNEKVSCQPNQHTESRFSDAEHQIYPKIKNGSFNLQSFSGDHWKGSLFFAALEQDYNCDKVCVVQISNALKQYRENCVGSCWEQFQGKYPSSTNTDLSVPIIDNAVIKQVSEDITRKDLTPLFKLLDISY